MDGIPQPVPLVQRLPVELLTKIFSVHRKFFKPPFREADEQGYGNARYPDEVSRLAHSDLLALGRVCSQWHAVAIKTPALWSDVELNPVLWEKGSVSPVVLELLRRALERSANAPLDLLITHNPSAEPPPASVLALLSAESKRWRTFRGPVFLFDVHGRLGHLEQLHIETSSSISPSPAFFGALPSLRSLSVPVSNAMLETVVSAGILFEHLTRCAFRFTLPDHGRLVSKTLPFATALPPGADLLLFFDLTEADSTMVEIPLSTLQISSLTLEIECSDNHKTIGAIFARLVLPRLASLSLVSHTYTDFMNVYPVAWPHNTFCELSARSGFATTLLDLNLYDVKIGRDDLLKCLRRLPALERLALSDHVSDHGRAMYLLDDNLFRALTMHGGETESKDDDTAPLVPRLRALRLRSGFKPRGFTDHVFAAFIVSRVRGMSSSGDSPAQLLLPVFDVSIKAVEDYYRNIDPKAAAGLEKYIASGELAFEWGYLYYDI
ncbi:hypothetical protein GGX14DRAFT_484453 [Mycena pura]|uniref:F-box domain-containing protein n=1 Tax=Mycena pura TaxID=153505 RepID=A0AAD6UMM1_9AGAR|nr:hypothetical protein GGX14DRAFT_484453 [Mycena pura]